MFRTLLFASCTFFASSLAFSEVFTLKSAVIKNDGTISQAQVYNSFGCTGANTSPDLEWSGAPKGTKTFAITMYDPDAPTGSGWWHWVVFNIPANVHKLAAGAGSKGGVMPTGSVQSKTDFGSPGYGGPCPPPGKPHRYQFKIYALKAPLDLKEDASAAMVGFNLNANKLAEASLQATYGR